MLENKTFVILHGIYDIQQTILQRESFGWKTVSFDNSHMYATRDINLSNIGQLKQLEYQYESAVEIARINNKKLRDWLLLEDWQYALYHILIIPIIIHKIIKKIYKKKLNQALEEINETQNRARILLVE